MTSNITLWRHWLLLGLLGLGLHWLPAQTTGDIAFVGFNADGDDGFAFVTLVDIPANTNLWFTDEEWDATTMAFGTGEGDLVWSNSSLTPAGTVIDIDGASATLTASLGAVTTGTNGGSGYSSSNEGLYCYLGTERNPTTWLTAFTNDVWGGSAGDLPMALTAGTNAIELGTGDDVAQYIGPRLGQATFAAYSPLIYDLVSNWEFQDGSGDQHNDGTAPDVPFDVTPFATGTADLIPPLAVSATLNSPTEIVIEFNEPIDATTASNVANYTFTPALTVNTATPQFSDSVVLDVAPLTDGVVYTLDILGVEDTAGNAMTTPSSFELVYNGTTPALVITEILYNNQGTDSLEFLEIVNNDTAPATLGGMTFVQGINFTFPSLTLAPNDVVLIAGDTAAASGFFGVPFPYQFGGALSNGGEDVILVNTAGDTIDLVDYDDAAPWPTAADGDGPSMELLNPALDNNVGSNWFASVTFQDTLVGNDSVFATPGVVSIITTGNLAFEVVNQTVSESLDTVLVVVTQSAMLTSPAQVKVALTNLATATNGSDFVLASDTLTLDFAPGMANQTDTVKVALTDDSDPENDEYVSFRLIEPVNASISSGIHTVYINDDDRLAPVATEAITLSLLGSYTNAPGPGSNSAEIISYAPDAQRLYVANSENNSVDILDFSDPANPSQISSIDISSLGGINSVAVYDTLVVAAVEAPVTQDSGLVVFMDLDGNILNQLTVGALPDMVTFTPDGSKVLVANEGEPNDDYSIDPEGSVSIITLSDPVAALTQADVDFVVFTSLTVADVESAGGRISGLAGTTVAEDLEPEYITVSANSDTAWVACQENNALIEIDLNTGSLSVIGLGNKDHRVAGAGLDATNEGDSVSIANYPFLGTPMPDAIDYFSVGGGQYLITANEGDAREYDAFEDESRLGDSDYLLDPTVFPDGDILKANVGRIKTINTEGDLDGDGDFDEIHLFGGRSFSIVDVATKAVIYDSGDDFELITAQDPVFGAIFNATDDENDFKDRSDDKGPEPEAVITAGINGQTYAFIALERIGGIMVYDVTDPSAPVFVQYVNNRDVNQLGGDLAPEDLVFIPFEQSPTGTSLLLVANEVSSTVAVYEIGGEITGEVVFSSSNDGVDEDASTLVIELEVSGVNPDSTVSVDLIPATFATADGSDFTPPASLTVTFGPGVSSQSISIDITDDSDAENDEYFSYRLGNAQGVNLGEDTVFVAYILDDDRSAPVATEAINLLYINSFSTGTPGDDAAEIVAYDVASQRLFASNSEANKVDVVDFSNPANPSLLSPIDISQYGAINSVAVYDGVVATAIENADKQQPGLVVFFDTDGNELSQVTVGALPDMVTFTPDGQTLLVANEGEPSDDYLNDPEGSISLIDVSGGAANVTQADVRTADFVSFNADSAQLVAQNIRIFGPGATVAQDLEPEYITVSPDGSTAYATCQENNALAVIDIASATVTSLIPLGLKDHSQPGNGLDGENDSDQIRIANYPIFGMYMPDAIASYAVGGITYLVTANEGDAREYDAYEEESDLEDLDLDPTAFPDGDLLQAAIGPLTVTTANGDVDGDGDFDAIWAFGARSFSIWNAADGSLVYDSGDDFERIIEADPKVGRFFNTTDDELDFKDRSDNKGPEPEAVVVGQINDEQYAFVALERIGGVMVFDVTDPTAPIFVDYDNQRDTASEGGDLAPEDLILIPNAQSPDGKYYLVVANEVSSTLTIYEVEGVMVGLDEAARLSLRMYPNPAQDGVTLDLGSLSGPVSARVLSIDGRELMRQQGSGLQPMTLNLRDLPQGVYLIDVETPQGRATQKLIKR